MAFAGSSAMNRRTASSSPRMAAMWMSQLASSGCAARIASASASVPCQTAASMNATRGSSLFDKAVARMAVVVDAVFLFQLLNVGERSLGVRAGDAVAERLVRVQQNLLETARQAHMLVRGQVVEQRGKTFLEPHRDVYTLDLERRAR